MDRRSPDRPTDNLKTWEVIRTDMDTTISELHRTVRAVDSGIVASYCKRLNAFNIRNDWSNHYTFREKKHEAVVSS